MNRSLLRCKSPAGLKFVHLDHSTLNIAVFVDASFANNPDLTSQLGFVVTLMDSTGSANIIHYGSSKSKRVTRSALAAELYALAHGFDIASALGTSIAEIFSRKIPLVLYTDSRSLYDSLVSLNSTSEKRLLIDLHIIRQAYERREITEVCWIPTAQNPADAMTKEAEKATPALKALMDTNHLHLTPNAWVERTNEHSPNIAPQWVIEGEQKEKQ